MCGMWWNVDWIGLIRETFVADETRMCHRVQGTPASFRASDCMFRVRLNRVVEIMKSHASAILTPPCEATQAKPMSGLRKRSRRLVVQPPPNRPRSQVDDVPPMVFAAFQSVESRLASEMWPWPTR